MFRDDDIYLKPPPEYDLVEEWLYEHDRRPSLAPCWPRSERMALVACGGRGCDKGATPKAIVLLNGERLDELFSQLLVGRARAWLIFFCVPRKILLDPVVCPEGLTEDSWKGGD